MRKNENSSRKPMNLDKSIWHDFELLTANREALEKLQFTKLKSLLLHLYRESPYYREKFDRADVNPNEFHSLEQYKDYPTFDKYEERKSQERSLKELNHPLGMHLTCDIRDVNRMSASSGTTGTPSFQGHTANDRKIMFRNFSRAMDMSGSKPGDRVMMAGVMSMWVAGIPTIDALLEFGANVIPIGGLVGSTKIIDMMLLTHPEGLICTPSFARLIVQKAQEMNVDLTKVGVKKIVVYGEPGGSVPEIVDELSTVFGGAQVFDIAGGTSCLNPIFVSCKEQKGMHFIAPDHAYIELYDRATGKNLPLEDGAEGEFIYTGLDRECGPLIRFMDGDKIRVNMQPCSCGLPGMRIHIIGRVDDMMLVKGVNVFPTAIQDTILTFKGEVTGNIRIVKESESPVVEPPLRIKVECSTSLDDCDQESLKARLEDAIQRKLSFKPAITLYHKGGLSMEYGPTGKVQLVEITN